MKKYKKKRIVRRKRRISEREIMRIKRKLKKSARKLRLGAKRTGAYVYGTLRRIIGNPGYGWAKNDIKLLGTSLKIEKGERVRYVEATNIPGGGVFIRPYYPKGIWKMQSEDTSIRLSPAEFSEEISMSEPRGEYRPTPQVAPAWKYGIYTGRGVVRKNPTKNYYAELSKAGIPMDHHESDLYVMDTPEARRILSDWPFGRLERFRSNIDGKIYIDVPFGYMPYWERKMRK